MLGKWRQHADFQAFLVRKPAARWTSDRPRIEFHANAIQAARLLNLDPARPIPAPLYPPKGRPSHQVPEVLRALFLMTFVGETSISRWRKRLLGEPILAIACGFRPGRIAAIASFYYVSDKLWPRQTGPVVRKVRRRSRKKPKSSEKLAPKRTGVVRRFFAQAKQGRRFDHRPERLLQELMARVVVEPSAVQ